MIWAFMIDMELHPVRSGHSSWVVSVLCLQSNTVECNPIELDHRICLVVLLKKKKMMMATTIGTIKACT